MIPGCGIPRYLRIAGNYGSGIGTYLGIYCGKLWIWDPRCKNLYMTAAAEVPTGTLPTCTVPSIWQLVVICILFLKRRILLCSTRIRYSNEDSDPGDETNANPCGTGSETLPVGTGTVPVPTPLPVMNVLFP